jgi:hypothetical protein
MDHNPDLGPIDRGSMELFPVFLVSFSFSFFFSFSFLLAAIVNLVLSRFYGPFVFLFFQLPLCDCCALLIRIFFPGGLN